MDSKENCNPEILGVKDRSPYFSIRLSCHNGVLQGNEIVPGNSRSQNESQDNSTSPLSCNQINDGQLKCYHYLESVGSKNETQCVSGSSEPIAPNNIDAITEQNEELHYNEHTRTEWDSFVYEMQQYYEWTLRPHKCEICGFVTKKKAYLTKHVNRIHPELRKTYKCHFCSYTSFKEIEQRKHMDVTHLGVKEYKCHMCKYTATVRDRLKRHIGAVHLKLKPHKCEHCGYATAWSSSLRYHLIHVHKIDD